MVLKVNLHIRSMLRYTDAVGLVCCRYARCIDHLSCGLACRLQVYSALQAIACAASMMMVSNYATNWLCLSSLAEQKAVKTAT